MPHRLRAKLSGLRYKGILKDKDYKRLCKALDNEDVLDKIIAGLKAHKWNKDEGSKAIYNSAINDAITYIEECKAESEK